MAKGKTKEELGGKKSRGTSVRSLAIWPQGSVKVPLHPPHKNWEERK